MGGELSTEIEIGEEVRLRLLHTAFTEYEPAETFDQISEYGNAVTTPSDPNVVSRKSTCGIIPVLVAVSGIFAGAINVELFTGDDIPKVLVAA